VHPTGFLSFVVPAHNEAQLIDDAVTHLHRAAAVVGRPYEIIVVDDGSTDGTGRLAEAAGARVVAVEVRQIAAARNAGARAAQGDALFFIDADTRLEAATLDAALTALAEGAAGGGAHVVFDGPVPRYAKPGVALVLGGFRVLNWTVGCFMFCRRSAFDAMGGFDERLYAAEEVAFSRALKREGRLVLVQPAVVTSARKFRTHSAGEMARMATSALFVGVRYRVPLWYGERRRDPGA
jgi:glycosyltransferase involved in cell wall biosynthesis